MLTYKVGEVATQLRDTIQLPAKEDLIKLSDERDDPLGPARGILLGLILSSIIWGGMFVIALAILKYK